MYATLTTAAGIVKSNPTPSRIIPRINHPAATSDENITTTTKLSGSLITGLSASLNSKNAENRFFTA